LYNDDVGVADFLVDSAIEFLFCAVADVDFYGDSWVVYVYDNEEVYFCRHLPTVAVHVCPYQETYVALAMVEVLATILVRL